MQIFLFFPTDTLRAASRAARKKGAPPPERSPMPFIFRFSR